MNVQEFKELMQEFNSEALFADGFDDAIIGYAERAGHTVVVAYDAQKCISILSTQGMSYEEAVEFFNFNVVGAWVGENTPIFITMYPYPEDAYEEEKTETAEEEQGDNAETPVSDMVDR